jgi:glycosyltransferase involved in cell wall biosynthesis
MPPLVSVRIITYNHEKYIAQCIEGVLMQRTNFPVEVIIGEDCSTDRTREFILQYQEKYPEKIKAILSPVNLGTGRNSVQVEQVCRGKYHAYCEGDDYWIDPLKLQKQVDFMEAHPEISMCFHDAFKVRYDKDSLPDYYCPPGLAERLTIRDLIRLRLAIPTASILARGEILSSLPEWRKEIRYGDLLARLWCAHHGDLAYLPEVMSVYRIHPGGMIMSNRSLDLHQATIVNIYRRFDAETAHRYSDLIESAIRETDGQYRFEGLRQRLGRLAFLLRPDKAIERWRRNKEILDRYGSMFRR